MVQEITNLLTIVKGGSVMAILSPNFSMSSMKAAEPQTIKKTVHTYISYKTRLNANRN